MIMIFYLIMHAFLYFIFFYCLVEYCCFLLLTQPHRFSQLACPEEFSLAGDEEELENLWRNDSPSWQAMKVIWSLDSQEHSASLAIYHTSRNMITLVIDSFSLQEHKCMFCDITFKIIKLVLVES